MKRLGGKIAETKEKGSGVRNASGEEEYVLLPRGGKIPERMWVA